jgi:hypothetical protein
MFEEGVAEFFIATVSRRAADILLSRKESAKQKQLKWTS